VHGWTSTVALGGFSLAAMLFVAFIMWEQRRESPMLDLSVFRNARFSAASAAETVAFFALFGFIFLITQYFQFVRGYSTLSAGLHTLPFAVAGAVSAPLAPRLVNRAGTARVAAGGLGLMAGGFLVAATISGSSSYWLHVVPSMVLIAAGLGLTTAPATEAIMGALPREKAGVGSAVNDTTRELGGTLGVAVVGSVFASVYGPRVVEGVRGLPISPAAADTAEESMAGAIAVADLAPADTRSAIVDAASSAFVDGLSMGSLVAAGTAAVGAVIALTFLPPRASNDPVVVTSAVPISARAELAPIV
jgi:DHA2 family multidrug resistance protein-like MFS transporter